jgi:hypothetical protein
VHDPEGALTTSDVGQADKVGGVLSTTVTLKLQLCPAVVDTLTTVVPIGKVEPDAGVDVTVPHSVLAVGVG